MKSFIVLMRNWLLGDREFSSQGYWSQRYEDGGNSGPGSYGDLAAFKAAVLNEFVLENRIESVIEFGCGDGNQLALASYSNYIGYDVSEHAVATCRNLFINDSTKQFFVADEYDGSRAELAISLDVIFHLIEDDIFDAYMRRLFNSALRHVVVYSSNQDEQMEPSSPHVRHRRFTSWIDRNVSTEWALATVIPNERPYTGDYQTTSFSNFYIYTRKQHSSAQ